MATLVTFNPQALTSPKFPIQLRSFGRSPPAIRRAKAMGSSSSSSVARFSSSSSPSVTGIDGSKVDALGDVSILAASTGEPVFFRDLWDQNEGMAVVALMRHFRCFCCFLFLVDCLYADPDHKAYDLLSLYYGLAHTYLNHASAKMFSRYESLKKTMKNYTIAATPDDESSVLQQGGMLVFKGKRLLYARKDEGTGDHAPLDDILDICCEVPAA